MYAEYSMVHQLHDITALQDMLRVQYAGPSYEHAYVSYLARRTGL